VSLIGQGTNNLVFYEAVAQLLPLMVITLLVEQASFRNMGHYDDSRDEKDSATQYLKRFADAPAGTGSVFFILLVVLGETMTLRVLFTGRASSAQNVVIILAVFLAGLALALPIALRSISDVSDFLPRKYRNIALVAGMTILGFGTWALLLYVISPAK
jgi:hypothetical protein